MPNNEISRLFQRYYEKTASEAEIRMLMQWINDPANEEELVQLMRGSWEGMGGRSTREKGMDVGGRGTEGMESVTRGEEGIEGGIGWDMAKYGLKAEKAEEILENVLAGREVEAESEPKKKIVWWGSRMAAAAVVAALLCGGTYWLVRMGGRKAGRTTTAPVALQKDVLPGGKRAVLTLADGSSIVLDSAGNGLVTKQGTTTINKTQPGQLTYILGKSGRTADAQGDAGEPGRGAEAVGYNTVATPRGGEYQVVLPDGSRVWLNAASSLRFPTAFVGAKREVELTGEAYFEIAGDKSRPFHVRVNGMQVDVLGTHFDVMAYEDEGTIKTTLLEGRVKVLTGNEGGVSLRPSQQATLDKGWPDKNGSGQNGPDKGVTGKGDTDKGGSGKGGASLKVTEANVEKVVAWKNGVFDFENEDIRSIMRQLARWYDVKVEFDGAIPTNTYTGEIRRQVPVSQVLQMLELVGNVSFHVEGNLILVKRK